MTTLEELRYPIGKFTRYTDGDQRARAGAIAAIEALPAALREAVRNLDQQQLETPYREGGWTVRQVVHHLADSHVNAYIRCKLLLSAKEPTINAYDEVQWAEMADGKTAAVEVSLRLLEVLHQRWLQCLRSLQAPAFARTLVHPENGRMTLDHVVGLYGWHGRHHVGHITSLRERRGW
jgi:uncharacterized damage-inducible protein DinB